MAKKDKKVGGVQSQIYKATGEWVKTASTKELVALGKKAVKFTNDRLRKLEKAGLKSELTTSGVRHKSAKSVTDRRSAIRAIQGARSMAYNPISTPGGYKKAMKEAKKTYPGKKLTLQTRASLQPFFAPKGTAAEYTKSVIANATAYWKYVHENEIDSDEAMKNWDEAISNGEDPLERLKRKQAEDEEYYKKLEEEYNALYKEGSDLE